MYNHVHSENGSTELHSFEAIWQEHEFFAARTVICSTVSILALLASFGEIGWFYQVCRPGASKIHGVGSERLSRAEF